MSAALLQREIIRRLGGNCRLRLAQGTAHSLAGQRLASPWSCTDCEAPCLERHATGQLGDRLAIEVTPTSLKWACPGCGHPVHEDTPTLLLDLRGSIQSIEADPLCHGCRSRCQGGHQRLFA